MKKLMNKIMLTCKKATFFSSIKNFKELSKTQRIQLKTHQFMCPHCRRFDQQSEIIDETIFRFAKNGQSTTEKLSKQKKLEMKQSINQKLN